MSIAGKFGKASVDNNYAVATTVKTARTAGTSVLAANDLSKFPTTTPAFFVTYKKTADPVTNESLITNQRSWKALVNPDNNTFTNLTLAPGYTDGDIAEGEFIEMIMTSQWGNSLVDGIFVSHNEDGTLKTSAVVGAITTSSLTTNMLADDAVTSDKINIVPTTDANGWKIYDFGGHKRYTFQKSNNSSFAMPAGQLNLDNIPLPVGVTDFRTKNPQVTLSTSNAQVVLGGYIGGATPDFNTLSIFAYNTGAGITLSYWHMFIQLTV